MSQTIFDNNLVAAAAEIGPKEYKNDFLNKKYILHEINKIQSTNHVVRTYKINKISLPYFDDKRYIIDDEFKALSFFRKDSCWLN